MKRINQISMFVQQTNLYSFAVQPEYKQSKRHLAVGNQCGEVAIYNIDEDRIENTVDFGCEPTSLEWVEESGILICSDTQGQL